MKIHIFRQNSEYHAALPGIAFTPQSVFYPFMLVMLFLTLPFLSNMNRGCLTLR